MQHCFNFASIARSQTAAFLYQLQTYMRDLLWPTAHLLINGPEDLLQQSGGFGHRDDVLGKEEPCN